MKVLLLAAGFGTRLRPLTNVLPKCLMPVCGRPLLRIWLDLLTSHRPGPDRILMNKHHLADIVDLYVEELRAMQQIDETFITVDETTLLGTGGTVVANHELLSDDAVLIAHADNLVYLNLEEFEQCHNARPEGTALTMMVFRTDSPQSCGIVELDERGVVQQMHEKVENPPGDLANAAIYIFSREVIEQMLSLGKEEIDIVREVLPGYMGRIATYDGGGYMRDIGALPSLLKAQRDYLQHAEVNSDPAWKRLLDLGSEFGPGQRFASAVAGGMGGALRRYDTPGDVAEAGPLDAIYVSELDNECDITAAPESAWIFGAAPFNQLHKIHSRSEQNILALSIL